jgi:DNA-binding NarL/FixJ family response regulator
VELVGSVADASEAQDLLRDGSVDIVLIDLHRRDDHEERVCRNVRHLTDLPIVVLASFMTPERWDRVRAAGATGYLLKQIDSEQFGRELGHYSEENHP